MVACSLAALRVSRNTLYRFLKPIMAPPPYDPGHVTPEGRVASN
jgi:hypothetical protein